MEKRKSEKYTGEDLMRAQSSILRTPTEAGRGIDAYSLDLDLVPLQQCEGKRILDLGAGQKLLFSQDLKANGIHADVVPFSPAFALRHIRERMPANEARNLAVAGMAEELPFADATFDRIVCHSLIEYLDTEVAYHHFLREVIRVLKPGGQADIAPLPSTHIWGYPLKLNESEMLDIVGSNVEVKWRTLPSKDRIFHLRLSKR